MAPIVEAPMPRIGSVSALGDLRLRVTWTRGIREGITEELDLAPIVNSQRYFRPLRSDPELFASVHPIVYGAAIAWGEDDDIDLSADAILRLALESMTGADLRAFIEREDLTETALAAILGYSRRQIVGFINEGRPVPRVVSLACRYVELANQPPQVTEDDTDDDTEDLTVEQIVCPMCQLAFDPNERHTPAPFTSPGGLFPLLPPVIATTMAQHYETAL